MLVEWFPESPVFSAIYRMTNGRFGYISRLRIHLEDPQPLGALAIHGEDGECLLRLCDQLNTSKKQFYLPYLPQEQNLTLRLASGQLLHEKLGHAKPAPEAPAE